MEVGISGMIEGKSTVREGVRVMADAIMTVPVADMGVVMIGERSMGRDGMRAAMEMIALVGVMEVETIGEMTGGVIMVEVAMMKEVMGMIAPVADMEEEMRGGRSMGRDGVRVAMEMTALVVVVAMAAAMITVLVVVMAAEATTVATTRPLSAVAAMMAATITTRMNAMMTIPAATKAAMEETNNLQVLRMEEDMVVDQMISLEPSNMPNLTQAILETLVSSALPSVFSLARSRRSRKKMSMKTMQLDSTRNFMAMEGARIKPIPTTLVLQLPCKLSRCSPVGKEMRAREVRMSLLVLPWHRRRSYLINRVARARLILKPQSKTQSLLPLRWPSNCT